MLLHLLLREENTDFEFPRLCGLHHSLSVATTSSYVSFLTELGILVFEFGFKVYILCIAICVMCVYQVAMKSCELCVINLCCHSH